MIAVVGDELILEEIIDLAPVLTTEQGLAEVGRIRYITISKGRLTSRA